MPNYTFELRDGSDPIEDDVGVSLTDRQDAYQYAQGVVRELMSGREAQTRTWRLDVYENSAERMFAIPFATLGATLDNLSPRITGVCGGITRAGPEGSRGHAKRLARIARPPRAVGR